MSYLILFAAFLYTTSGSAAGFKCPDVVKVQVNCDNYYTQNDKLPRIEGYSAIYNKEEEYENLHGRDVCQYRNISNESIDVIYNGVKQEVADVYALRSILESVEEFKHYNFSSLERKKAADVMNISYYRKSFSTQRVANIEFEGILNYFKMGTSGYYDIKSDLKKPYERHLSGFSVELESNSRLAPSDGGYLRNSTNVLSRAISGDCRARLTNNQNKAMF